MSQRYVERVIGRLVTDEAFRRRFAEHPAATLLDPGARAADPACLCDEARLYFVA